MSGIHLLPPLSKDYTTFCHQVVSVIVQEFIYYLPCPKTIQPFAIRWFLSLFRNSFIIPLSKYYGTFCHQVVSVIVQEFIYYLPCPNIMERSAIRWCLVIVQEFIYYLPCPKTMQPFAIRWCLSLFRNSFITFPVQILWNVLPSGGVCHCSGIHLLPPLCKYYRMFCHQVVSVIVQEFIYYLLCPKTMQPFAIRWCLSLFSN